MSSLSQIRFQLQWQDRIDHSIRIDSAGYTVKSISDSGYFQSSPQTATVILPKPGRYQISFSIFEPLATLDIPDTSHYVLTLPEDAITERFYGIHGARIFENKGRPISGYLHDFYPSGHMRIRGTFAEGRPRDSLVYFHANGQASQHIRYTKRYLFFRDYDSLGRLERRSRNKRTFYLTDFKSRSYYANGHVRDIHSSKRQVERRRTYYTNGQLQTLITPRKLATYFDNGKLQSTVTWRRKRVPFIGTYPHFEFIIKEKYFDSAGVMIKRLIYEQWQNSGRHPSLGLSHADWIILCETYIDGERKVIARDLSAEKFLEME